MTISAIESRPARSLAETLREQMMRVVQWAARRREAARTRRELSGLSEVELKDIGITRCAIDDVARGTAGRYGALAATSPERP